MNKIIITFGTDKEETKTYFFKTLEEKEAFIFGISEMWGWWEYEIISEKIN
tara:strand:+ start:487 stop:639 length:153 start_codon:yes stop_codon:yes gene_type:complete